MQRDVKPSSPSKLQKSAKGGGTQQDQESEGDRLSGGGRVWCWGSMEVGTGPSEGDTRSHASVPSAQKNLSQKRTAGSEREARGGPRLIRSRRFADVWRAGDETSGHDDPLGANRLKKSVSTRVFNSVQDTRGTPGAVNKKGGPEWKGPLANVIQSARQPIRPSLPHHGKALGVGRGGM